MSYPAQNTDTQYQCLLTEVDELRNSLRNLLGSDNYSAAARTILAQSDERLLKVYRQFEFETLFGVPVK
jgi:hypothetical protein